MAVVTSGPPVDWRIVGLAAFVVGVVLSTWKWERWRAERLRQLVVQHDGRLCPSCRHGLSGLPAKAQCPECGRWHDVEKLRAEWFEAFGLQPEEPNRGNGVG